MSDVNNILEQIKSWSLFDLDRLSHSIRELLNDTDKHDALRHHLTAGMHITYFNYNLNKCIEATILDIKKTRASIINIDDKKRWNIPLCWINLEGVDTRPPPKKRGSNLDRSAFSIGDTVGWSSNRYGHDLYGIITKLNPKTAKIRLGNGERWTVYYGHLFLVMDGVTTEDGKHIPFIYENVP